jgi:small-conductance mechanosensitive channel
MPREVVVDWVDRCPTREEVRFVLEDYLSGIAMIVEDQLGIGDVVDLGPVTGTVEEVTLRVTKLRDASGVVWYVRNGEVMRVANRSQGWTMAIVDMPVAYDAVAAVIRRGYCRGVR